MERNQFLQKNGSLIIPKQFVPFVVVKIPEKKICLECGKEFYPTHDNQKFCPHPDGKKMSRCQNTHNTRVKRKRKKEREGKK